jgi:LacI family transcriptional regulator
VYESPFYQRSGKWNSKNARSLPIDGIIAHLQNRNEIKKIVKSRTPAIIQGIEEMYEDSPTIVGNDALVGRIGAKHFIERGFSNIAFFGDDNMYWSRIRCQAFCQYGTKNKKTIFTFCSKKTQKKTDKFSAVVEWLNNLPKPVGIMACNDDYARDLIETCVIEKIRVPEHVAILGTDNDDFICEISDIPLSSIAYNSEKAGYEAAALLDNMMRGKKITNFKIYVEPLYVVTRLSTDTMAIKDISVSSGINYIRNHVREKLSVENVASAMMLSRRMAELKFKKNLGRTIFEVIQTYRIQLICKLLIESNLTVSEIASKTGFTTTYMISFFKKQSKTTPKAYRLKHQHL